MFICIGSARDGGFIVRVEATDVVFAGTLDDCLVYTRKRLEVPKFVPVPVVEKPNLAADAEKSEEARAAEANKNRISVEELIVPTRVWNMLHNERIKYVDEVKKMTDDQLLRFQNFGRVSLRDLREAVKKFEEENR
jgi:DNA-directed RNA polymerase alpha subunit